MNGPVRASLRGKNLRANGRFSLYATPRKAVPTVTNRVRPVKCCDGAALSGFCGWAGAWAADANPAITSDEKPRVQTARGFLARPCEACGREYACQPYGGRSGPAA